MSGYPPPKRSGGFSHYDNNRAQKHPRNTGGYPANAGHNNSSNSSSTNNSINSQRVQQDSSSGKIKNKDNIVLNHISRLPDPAQCELCKLSGEEIEGGAISILAMIEAQELSPDGDRDILRLARELRDRLTERNSTRHAARVDRLDQIRPAKDKVIPIPAYVERKLELAKDLPPLPPISEPHLEEQVFTHVSIHGTRVKGIDSNEILAYDRLEFLGDAYIEVMASRLIASRLPQVDVPEQSHFREQLVRNDTLGAFSTAYGLPDRLKHGGHIRESKAWGKVVADVFEAYVAAIVLSDPQNGFATAEKWLTELWAPQLLSYKEAVVENTKAKDEIQRLVLIKNIKLDYRQERDMTHENGVQNFYIGLYMTGWGYNDQHLGSGEGRNKAQASVFAAMDALRRSGDILNDASKKKQEFMKNRRGGEKEKSETRTDHPESQKPAAEWDADNAKKAAEVKAVNKGANLEEEDGPKAPKTKTNSDWLEQIAQGNTGSAFAATGSHGNDWLEKEKKRKEKKEKKSKKNGGAM